MVNKEPYQKAFLEKMVRDVEPRYGLFNQNGNDTLASVSTTSSKLIS